MTHPPTGLRSPEAPPGGPGPPAAGPRPWWQRWPVWVAVAAVVVGASIVSDLPTRATLQDKVRVAATVVRQINTDAHSCAFAASQSFSIYRRVSNGTFPASDRGFIPTYLKDDQQACSFADQSIYSMSTITVPNSDVGSALSSLIKAVFEWTTSDAVGAIVDIEALVKTPGDTKALHDLSARETGLAKDRATAQAQLRAVERTLSDSALPALGLPRLPHPG